VTIAVDRQAAVGDARGTNGRVLLESNDPAEPSKELPLFAFGALNPDAGK
jgi:hypothetical protein